MRNLKTLLNMSCMKVLNQPVEHLCSGSLYSVCGQITDWSELMFTLLFVNVCLIKNMF